MAKVINQYEAVPGYTFTAADIQARSNVGTGVVSGTTVNVTNITTAQIRNATGVASNSVGVLASSTAVNRYTHFCPKTVQKVTISKDLIVDVPNAPYYMGDFAGFNSSAVVPYLEANYSDGQYITLTGCCAHQTLYYTFKVHLGEFDYSSYLDDGNGNTADYVIVELYDVSAGTVLTDYWFLLSQDFSIVGGQDIVSDQKTLSISLSNITFYKEIEARVYFGYRVDETTMNTALVIKDSFSTIYAREDYQVPTSTSVELIDPWKDGTSCTIYPDAYVSHGTITIECNGDFTIANLSVNISGTTYSDAVCDIAVSTDGGTTWITQEGSALLDSAAEVTGSGTISAAIDCSTDIRFRLAKVTCL